MIFRDSTTGSELNRSRELYLISRDLMDSACEHARQNQWEIVLRATEIFLGSARLYSQLLVHPLVRKRLESAVEKPLSAAQLLDAGKQRILKWLKETFYLSMDDITSVSPRFRYEAELRVH